MKEYTSYSHGEAKTGVGQHVSFTCESEDVERVKALLEEHVRDIEIPTTHAMNVQHGGFGRYTRYQIKQHKYAGGSDEGGGGFIEVIEIENPPGKRHPIIIHEYNTRSGGCFSEWHDVRSAEKAFEKNWGSCDWHEKISSIPGFKRFVKCGDLSPWFYAVGEEELVGDYALASGLEDDPVFRLGRKFVVPGDDRVSKVKTCMGSRFVVEHRNDPYSPGTDVWRVVYFDDGTTLRIHKDNTVDNEGLLGNSESSPRLLRDEEVWITEAMEQFNALLSGMKAGFQIKFSDGRVFTAKLSHKGKAVPSVEGNYLLKVRFIDSSTKEGWINDFIPTEEHSDIVSFVRAKFPNNVIEKINIIQCVPKRGGKKWSGAFFIPQSV